MGNLCPPSLHYPITHYSVLTPSVLFQTPSGLFCVVHRILLHLSAHSYYELRKIKFHRSFRIELMSYPRGPHKSAALLMQDRNRRTFYHTFEDVIPLPSYHPSLQRRVQSLWSCFRLASLSATRTELTALCDTPDSLDL